MHEQDRRAVNRKTKTSAALPIRDHSCLPTLVPEIRGTTTLRSDPGQGLRPRHRTTKASFPKTGPFAQGPQRRGFRVLLRNDERDPAGSAFPEGQSEPKPNE